MAKKIWGGSARLKMIATEANESVAACYSVSCGLIGLLTLIGGHYEGSLFGKQDDTDPMKKYFINKPEANRHQTGDSETGNYDASKYELSEGWFVTGGSETKQEVVYWDNGNHVALRTEVKTGNNRS